ncbi:MAG TPA: helix-turn-helix domain-containing protein [Ktedonobacteraceae bacterium]
MMTAIEQLQQIGLNKYEAEAYYTLLAEGPLTGYELGKRSQVPLSKSYEVLERLTQKGLALLQPSDPPRYKAEDSHRFLGQVRQNMTKTLDDLAISLAAIVRSPTNDEFWVLRGYQHILVRAQAMVIDAQQTIYLYIPAAYEAELVDVLARVKEKGCQIFRASTAEQSHHHSDVMLLLVDGLEVLAGTLTSAGRSQAVVSSNQAIVTAISSFFAQQSPVESVISSSSSVITSQNDHNDRLDWVAWEDYKQRRLWRVGTDNRVA